MCKEAKCIDCGKPITINKRASIKTCRCNECLDIYKHKKRKEDYNKSLVKSICLYCGKEYIGKINSKFCSIRCSQLYDKNNDFKYKEAKCIDCGKPITINKRASIKTCRCNECLKNHKNNKKLKQCKICGNLYLDKCENNFCKNHNIQQFNILIKYFGFDKNKLGTNLVEYEYNRIRDILYDLYWNKGYSSADIGKLFHYKNSNHIVQDIFIHMNIPKRNLSDANKLSILNKDKYVSLYCYNKQWHTTWNNKEVYLRSSYELDYAKELDNKQIDYDVEFKRIKYWDSQRNEYRCAIPDFYIPSTNTIVEIKSTWTLDKQNMKDKMKAYQDLGYNFKLICDHNEINLN